MDKHSYAQEKLYLALRSLSSGPGDARSRLLDCSHIFFTLNENDFPPELQNEWNRIIRKVDSIINRYGPLHDYKGDIWRGSFENSMKNIRNNTASKIALNLFELFVHLIKSDLT